MRGTVSTGLPCGEVGSRRGFPMTGSGAEPRAYPVIQTPVSPSRSPLGLSSLFSAGPLHGVRAWVFSVFVVAIVVSTEAFIPWFQRHMPPLLWLTVAVVVAAWRGGLWPGLSVTGLCAAAIHLLELQSHFGWPPNPRAELLRLGVFLLTGALISVFAESLHEASRRERAQSEALRISEERLRLVGAATKDAIWDWDIPNTRVSWGAGLETSFGWNPETVGTSTTWWAAHIHPDDRLRVQSSIRAAVRDPERTYWQEEYRLQRADGSFVAVFDRGSVVRSADGRAVRMVGAILDVSDHRQNTRELASALGAAEAANRAKDAFLAALSHELRTPLTPVLFLATTLERSREVPQKLRDDFAMIRRNIELEAHLIDDLLDLTRISRGKLHLDLALADLHAVLDRCLELLREEIDARALKLSVERTATHIIGQADAVRLQQVIWNVLKNAVKFTPAGGAIVVRTENPEPGEWHLIVRDSGLGITAEEMPHIFESFSQGRDAAAPRFGGLGLGLAISSLLVKEHGGRIWAESEGRNRGATFHIELPLIRTTTDLPPAPRPMEPASSGGSARLLVVEDHTATRETLQRLLGARGYDVSIAADAQQARELASSHRFDLLVSDLGLPDGNGLDLAAEFRRLYGLRGIALSGFGMEEDLHQSRVMGFLDHLTKPVDIERLTGAIAQALEAQNSAKR